MTTHNLAAQRSASLTEQVPAAPFKALARFFSSFRAGIDASREYEQLSAMTDAALAARGLKREDICRQVFDKHFAN